MHLRLERVLLRGEPHRDRGRHRAGVPGRLHHRRRACTSPSSARRPPSPRCRSSWPGGSPSGSSSAAFRSAPSSNRHQSPNDHRRRSWLRSPTRTPPASTPGRNGPRWTGSTWRRGRRVRGPGRARPGAGRPPRCGCWPAWRRSTTGQIRIDGKDMVGVPSQGPRHRDGVPELRAVPEQDGRREHGVRAEDAGRGQGPSARAGSRRPPSCSTWRTSSTASRAICPAGSGSGWPWAGPSSASPRCSAWTSRCPTSTPSCGCRPAPRSRRCSAGWGPPPCTSPTTRSRP